MTSADSLLWLRRDLRRGDQPALGAAAANGTVLACFVVDPKLFDPAGPGRARVRRHWLGGDRLALRGAARSVGQPVRVRLPGVHAVRQGLARARLAGASTRADRAAAGFGPK